MEKHIMIDFDFKFLLLILFLQIIVHIYDLFDFELKILF